MLPNVYPSNVSIFGMNRQFDNPRILTKDNNIDPVLCEFYTDGSCLPNPGPGGWKCINLFELCVLPIYTTDKLYVN